MKLRLFNIITFIFCLVILSIDFWVTDIFRMEGIYYPAVCLLLFFLLPLYFIKPSPTTFDEQGIKGLKILFHIILIALALFNFKLIFIMWFGYGFSGETIPLVFHLCALGNLMALISGVSLFLRKYRLTK